MASKNLSPQNLKDIKVFLRNEKKLISFLRNHSSPTKEVYEMAATELYKREGKSVPGFIYSSPGNIDQFSYSAKLNDHDSGVGLFGLDFLEEVKAIMAASDPTVVTVFISEFRPVIIDLICLKLNYCKTVAKEEELSLAISICEALLGSKLGTSIPIVGIGIFMLKRGYFNQLCGCVARD